MQIKITFISPLLGSTPRGDIHEQWIATKAPAPENGDEESASAPDLDKGVTGFHRTDDGQPCLYDYVIKGFFKDACSMMRQVKDSASSTLQAYKQKIDGLVFVQPRQVILLPAGEITMLSRPLRASTPQGARVAIATSECLPAGTTAEFSVESLGVITEAHLKEWLHYGRLRGLGQWRNGGYGSFTYYLRGAAIALPSEVAQGNGAVRPCRVKLWLR